MNSFQSRAFGQLLICKVFTIVFMRLALDLAALLWLLTTCQAMEMSLFDPPPITWATDSLQMLAKGHRDDFLDGI